MAAAGWIRAYVNSFDEAWTEMWNDLLASGRRPRQRDQGWQASIAEFARRGIDFDTALGFLESARTARDPWAYFCGCCWTRLRETRNRKGAQTVANADKKEKETKNYVVGGRHAG